MEAVRFGTMHHIYGPKNSVKQQHEDIEQSEGFASWGHYWGMREGAAAGYMLTQNDLVDFFEQINMPVDLVRAASSDEVTERVTTAAKERFQDDPNPLEKLGRAMISYVNFMKDCKDKPVNSIELTA